jgi:hypothetical protein
MTARDELLELQPDEGFTEARWAAKIDAFLAEHAHEVRVATLREVRNLAIAMDRNPDNDPYLWGYGANEICKVINALFKEARDGGDQG